MARKSPTPPNEFATRRLLLRPPLRTDARAVFEAYAQDPLVTRYLPWSPHRSIGDTREFLRRTAAARKKGTEYTWAIVLRPSGVLIGMIALRIAPPKADFGFVLARPYWNSGYATEAAGAVVRWAISQNEIHRVWALCDVDNVPSARVLEKLGMQLEGTLRRWMRHSASETPCDCHCYALIKEA